MQAMRADDLLQIRPEGLYCPAGGFHIDPVTPVDRAIITHGHSDHARSGHRAVLATPETLGIMDLRLGRGFAGTAQSLGYGESLNLGGVTVRLHPAGHVLGSAQVGLEFPKCRVVASGDYKDAADPTCAPLEVVACDVFVTEATFGLPVFRHGAADVEIARLLKSLATFPERPHLVGAYSLGKAQRVIALLRRAGFDAPIHIHGALEKMCAFYAERNIALGALRPVREANKSDLAGAVVVAPPSALGDRWAQGFSEPVRALASGWMRIRARARQSGIELPLVISDHADWDGLTRTIRGTGASEIWVTHGEETALVHWCRQQGLAARPLTMLGYGDEDDAPEIANGGAS